MIERIEILVTFAYACQRGTENVLVLDALERIYAIADATTDAGRQSAYDFLRGFHAGLMQIDGAEVEEDVRKTYDVSRSVLWHAMTLYEGNAGPGMEQAIQLAESYCLKQFGVIAHLREGTAVLPAQPNQHVRAWNKHVWEADAYWMARLRGEGEPLNMDPGAVRAVLKALGGPA